MTSNGKPSRRTSRQQQQQQVRLLANGDCNPQDRDPLKLETRSRSNKTDQMKALFYYHNHQHLAIILVIVSVVSLVAHTSQAHAPYYSSTSSSVRQEPDGVAAATAAASTATQTPETDQQQQNAQLPQLVVSHKSPLNGRQFGDTINDISIECNSHNIVVTLQTSQGFNGMIYPKGLSKNSTCMMEYHQLSSNITYYLPLKSCNTMSTDVEDGVEYFNTVMVQPHRRLVTNQGRGYHIRCRYQTKERTITNQEQQLSVNLTQSTPSVMGSASMPTCTMRIYSATDLSHEVSAENVRIGDELHLIIGLDEQDVYGMLVTNCLVRDGMNWGEQPLIDDHGCPVDEEIMPEFTYASNLTRASVTFQAHKFPYTSSVYYQCNVRLCFRDSGGCSHVPPNCGGGSGGGGSNSARPGSGGGGGNQLDAFSSNYKSAGGPARLPPLLSAQQQQQQQQHDSTNDIPFAGTLAGTGPSSHKQRSSTRTRRWVDGGELDAVALPGEQPLASRVAALDGGRDLSIEVSSGLHVDESELEPSAAAESPAALTSRSTESDPLMPLASGEGEEETSVVGGGGGGGEPSEEERRQQRRQSERDFCLSLRKFAIIVSLISLLLMTLIIIMIAWLIQRRNRQQKLDAQMQSTYDHHHTNRAYCR